MLPGVYTVVQNFPSAANQVELLLLTSNYSSYFPTGGNGFNQTVSVTVSNGKLNISGSGIEMVNSINPSDSSALNFSITQQ